MRFLLCLLLLGGTAFPLSAQHEHGGSDAPVLAVRPMPLYTTLLGPYSRRITTRSPEAQAYFTQGLQLEFAFTLPEAAKSFREAEARDSTCAICYWGEAWALGAYLNEAMPPANAPLADAAIARAVALAPQHATAVEQALIAAMRARYEPTWDAARRSALDSAYAREMRSVHQRFPRDEDVATLYAESLMLLEPRRGSWSVEKPAVAEIHAVLASVLARDIRHPGACHLYIHATESTTVPEKAAACAEYLGSAIPGASHINHMPSHTWNRLGRWGDAVRSNLTAWHSDQKAATGGGFAIYPGHNLHMLLFAASEDGQGAIAMQAGKDYAKITPGGTALQALTMLRFGRFEEILPLAAPEPPILRGLWRFARGYAQLRLGQRDSARASLALVDSLADAVPDSITFRGHTAGQLLGVTGGILRAELARADGRLPDAVDALQVAVTLEDGLRYDEPEPLNFSARHWLGALLLEAGRPREAEAVYRAELERHPHNGWSLFGLAQALRGEGQERSAADAQAAFETAWARADVWLTASRF